MHPRLYSLLIFTFSVIIMAGQNRLCGIIEMDSLMGGSPILVQIPEIQTQVLTNKKGEFCFSSLRAGTYKVIVEKMGYRKMIIPVEIKDSLNFLNVSLAEQVNELDEIVVFGTQQSKQSQTSANIDLISSRQMHESGALNLSDGISKLPGVSQLSTGPGISKPVIRGLFGNRIQTVLFGIKFDNQQWQDEHGLGLSDAGVERVEIIKGAASLLYGSEAMGGIIHIISEAPAPLGTTSSDISTRVFSNTLGYAADAGVKRSTQKLNWGLRLGTESHADYSDGNNKRILNSRFGGNNVKGTLGFKHKNWSSENNYLFSKNNFGFIMDAYQLLDKPDDRGSRSFERPHHTVLLNLFSSQNNVMLRRSKLKINLGTFFNNREEQEGSGGISLNMLLNSYNALFVWIKDISPSLQLSIGSQNQYQTNRNIGSRIIVPDGDLLENSLFTYLKKNWKFFSTEGGIRYDIKNISTLNSGVLNNGDPSKPGARIVPITKNYNVFNGAFGFSAFDQKHVNLKMNFSSGYRAPNLAELSSNGLHEGSVRYEVGDQDLKVEQNFCFDVHGEFYNSWFSIVADAYMNRFLNYIYLQPSSKDYLGFTIYNYIQQNAILMGMESGLRIHPPRSGIELRSTYSTISGKTDRGDFLPFISPAKINNELRLKIPARNWLQNNFISASYIYVFAQNSPAQFETSTPAYALVNFSAGTDLKAGKNTIIIALSGNNLLNEVYYDHLSRFKNYGVYNIGRSLSLSIKLIF